MLKQITASLLVLQLCLPINLAAAVNAVQQKPNNIDVQLLLQKPLKTYAPAAKELGISTVTIAAMSAAAINQNARAAREVFLKTRPLDALVENVLGMMHLIQRDQLLAKYNPTLNREVSRAFMDLRSKYNLLYCLDPKNPAYQEIPSNITNRFVFVLDDIKFMRGDPHALKFKELIKETNYILGRKQAVKSAKGGAAGIILLAVGAIGAVYLMAATGADNNTNLISNTRAAYTTKLLDIQKAAPQLLAFTAINMDNQPLVADIIAEDGALYQAVHNQITQMTAPQTQQAILSALNAQETLKTLALKTQLSPQALKNVQLPVLQ